MTVASDFKIRTIPANEIDLLATVTVINAAFRRHTILAEDRTSVDAITEEFWPGCRFVQAFDGDELVGTASIAPGDVAPVTAGEYPGIGLARCLYFGIAGVRPGRMGGGIGAALLAETERIARAEGFHRVILTTIEEMGNVAYYNRFGYRTVSVEELAIGHWSLTIPTHFHCMVKDLTAETFRWAVLEDATELAVLINRAYRVEDFFKIGDRTDIAEVAAAMSTGPFILATDHDHRLIGGIHVEVRGARGYFGMLAVHPEVQGRGLGRQLIAAAETHCRSAGCRGMDLDVVNLRQELPAFYESLGYRVCGTAPFPAVERISQPCHFIIMSKPLLPLTEPVQEVTP